MSVNLINLMKDYLTPEVISKASSFIGENDQNTAKAADVIIPSVLGGLLNKAKDENGLAAVANLLSSGGFDGNILNNVLGLFNGGENTDNVMRSGASAVTSIFGDGAMSGLLNLISSNSGIQASSSNKLLNLVTPVLMGLIGKQTAGGGLKALGSLLGGQKDFIAAAAPAGLASVLGLGSLSGLGGNLVNWASDAVSSATSTVTNTASTAASATKEVAEDTAQAAGGLMKWLLPLILIAAAIAALLFLTKGCKGGKGDDVAGPGSDSVSIVDVATNGIETTITEIKGKFDSLTGNFIYDEGAITVIQLPNNAGTLKVGENSTEAKLVAFLNDPNSVVDTVKGNWFDFTNVRFKTGSSEITPESMTQLKNLVAISKGFPTAQFKVGGYTDNTGDAAKNVALSQKRADAVAAQVVKLGAAKSAIVGAEGYGQEHPVCPANDTEECRAQNRRVSVRVKAK
ncbi:MAG TPA: OmpA family protein [Chitinophagales bacterium]|nr:OmpA family protein [Chitinophagales bacterium]HNL84525.1 OmpA family protein [Chitinophagales bacterium]